MEPKVFASSARIPRRNHVSLGRSPRLGPDCLSPFASKTVSLGAVSVSLMSSPPTRKGPFQLVRLCPEKNSVVSCSSIPRKPPLQWCVCVIWIVYAARIEFVPGQTIALTVGNLAPGRKAAQRHCAFPAWQTRCCSSVCLPPRLDGAASVGKHGMNWHDSRQLARLMHTAAGLSGIRQSARRCGSPQQHAEEERRHMHQFPWKAAPLPLPRTRPWLLLGASSHAS